MNDDAAPQGDVSDDLVAGHRGATARQPRQDSARPDDAHPGLLFGSAVGERERGERGALLSLPFLFLLGLYLLDYTAGHVLGREHACADGGEHVVRRWVVGRAGHVLEDSGGDLPDPSLLEKREYLLPSQAQVVLSVGPVEELPDLVARPSALDHGQPVPARTRVLPRDDLDPVPRDQLGIERHDPVVDPGPYRAVADLGVDVVGEVYGRRPAGKADHVALRREHEDLIGDELALQRLHEVAGVGRLLLPLHHALEPGEAIHLAVGKAVLVHPVGRDAVLRRRVHLGGPDLDLQELPLVGHDGRVQRLVHVELGHRYVVLEAARDRLPDRVYDAEGAVAVADVVDDDPEAGEVVDLVELLVAAHHLVVDRVKMLDPAVDLGIYPRLPQMPQ